MTNTTPPDVSRLALDRLDFICIFGQILHHGQLGYNCEYTQLERAKLVSTWTVSGHGTASPRIQITPTADGFALAAARKAQRQAARQAAEQPSV